MSTEIIVALLTGAFTILGVVITVIYGNKYTKKQIAAQNDLTLYRIQELEKKQDKHNNLIERQFKLEERQSVLEERQNNIIEQIGGLKH